MQEDKAIVYQIKIKGRLDRRWAEWFDGMTITSAQDGNTLLTGPAQDQAALLGLIRKVRDLGIPLISVQPFEAGRTEDNCEKDDRYDEWG